MAAFPTTLLAAGYGLAAVPAAGLALTGHGGWALPALWLGGAAAVLAITLIPILAQAFPRRPGPPGAGIVFGSRSRVCGASSAMPHRAREDRRGFESRFPGCGAAPPG